MKMLIQLEFIHENLKAFLIKIQDLISSRALSASKNARMQKKVKISHTVHFFHHLANVLCSLLPLSLSLTHQPIYIHIYVEKL